jgi:hypothetical protein
MNRRSVTERVSSPATINARRHEIEILLLEGPILAVTIRLDPAPASHGVSAGDDCDVPDAGHPHDFIPASRPCEIAASLGIEAHGRVGTASDDVLRRESVVGVLELEHSWHAGSVVVFGEATVRQQRLGVGEWPAPSIEPDDPLKLDDRFSSNRIAVER